MDFKLPEIGEGVYEAEATRWLVEVGQAVRPGQGLLEVLTDKATMEVPAPFAGKITQLKIEPGDTVKVGQEILVFEPSDGEVEKAPEKQAVPEKPAVKKEKPAEKSTGFRVPVKAAPTVRVLARKLGVDLQTVQGSGPDGRILLEDLTDQLQPQKRSAPRKEPAPDWGRPGTRVKLIGLRRKIAEHMVHSKQTIPHFAYVDECDVSDLVKIREQMRDLYVPRGVRITYLPFFVKAVVGALKEVPIVNATFEEESNEIVLHDHYNIGIAVATPAGLIVPVIQDADKKSLLELAQEIDRLSSDARAGKSKVEDLRGGTFTITSIGNFGGLFASPVIHAPQVGILAMGKIVKRPIFDSQGQVKPADMIYLSMAFDHRVLDGAPATAFGNAILRRLQKPMELVLGERGT